ncbi:MAG: hypothetical protein J6K03_01305 [Oscillospiraceae bacterium]|nr:hypothetical protein [Oscillospiraceae bacterium]
MKQMKRRFFMGAICEQVVHNVSDGVKNIEEYDPEKIRKDRFESEEAYLKFKTEISRRNHLRQFHANFSPTSIYCTPTFDDEWEVHTFEEAKIVRKRFVQALKRAYPDAVIFLYMGRGKSTNRIHFHMVSEGIPEEFIKKKWKYGQVRHPEHLREHCWYDGVDHGQDYTGLANYLFNHWTEEVGGHRYFRTKNARKPDKEPATEVHIRGGYSEKRPPVAPKGYKLVDIKATKYGCIYFKYVVIPKTSRKEKSEQHRHAGRLD